MNLSQWWNGWRGPSRPDATPTILSLATATALLGAALMLPDQSGDQAVAATQVQRVDISPVRPRQKVSLRDRLVVGLQARLKSEVEFVELVALRAETGQLPRRLVDETFFWARQRAEGGRHGRPRRPILFFEPALRLRAERLNVEL